jgi:hypothetical protein
MSHDPKPEAAVAERDREPDMLYLPTNPIDNQPL